MDEWSEFDFLFIEDLTLKPHIGDHRASPDIASLNRLFSYRLSHKLPTILVCSEDLIKASKLYNADTSSPAELIREQWGSDFLELLLNNANVFVELHRAKK